MSPYPATKSLFEYEIVSKLVYSLQFKNVHRVSALLG